VSLIVFRIIGWFLVVAFISLITVNGYTPFGSNKYWLTPSNPSIIHAGILNSENYSVSEKLSTEDFGLVKKYSSEYGIDHRLIMAIIAQESQFDISAESHRGAIGLMQLMPVTSAEVAENIGLDETHVVAGNIKSGIYYFTKLFQLFPNTNADDHLCLTLAAYNAGPSRIYDAQELAAYMGENPNSWSVIQKILPLLSKRYYSLHQAVWSDGRPPSGYFGSSHQTISYVENTMKIYKDIL
jgi:membrane-bound lytic murein transglycosylase F